MGMLPRWLGDGYSPDGLLGSFLVAYLTSFSASQSRTFAFPRHFSSALACQEFAQQPAPPPGWISAPLTPYCPLPVSCEETTQYPVL